MAGCYDVELITKLIEDTPEMSVILNKLIEQLHCNVVALQTKYVNTMADLEYFCWGVPNIYGIYIK